MVGIDSRVLASCLFDVVNDSTPYGLGQLPRRNDSEDDSNDLSENNLSPKGRHAYLYRPRRIRTYLLLVASPEADSIRPEMASVM